MKSTVYLIIVLLGFGQNKLQYDVFVASNEGFNVTSTIIYGEKEAILIDGQFLLSDAYRLTARIIDIGKSLKTVYVTHFHPDHYFGLEAIKTVFPEVSILALPEVVREIKTTAEKKLKQWKPVYGKKVSSKPIIPKVLEQNHIYLEGNKIEFLNYHQGDSENNTIVSIPSLNAYVVGDIAYNKTHLWMAETDHKSRLAWLNTLDFLIEKNPSIVVAGHKKRNEKDDISSLYHSRQYIIDFNNALAKAKNQQEFKSIIIKKYLNMDLEIAFNIAAGLIFKKD